MKALFFLLFSALWLVGGTLPCDKALLAYAKKPLAIHKSPHSRAPVIAKTLPEEEVALKIHRCRRHESALWCEVSALDTYVPTESILNVRQGWARADDMACTDGGWYVLIDNEAGCDFSLGCTPEGCEVIEDVFEIGHRYLPSKTKHYPRDRLLAVNRFEAMEEGGDGYCNIDTYLLSPESPEGRVAAFWMALKAKKYDQAARFIHPKEGVILTDWPSFGGPFRHFMPEAFAKALKNNRPVLPRYEGGKEESPAPLGVRDFFRRFPPLKEAVNLQETNDRADYPNRVGKAVEIVWDTAEGLPQGMVRFIAVLDEYEGKWYIEAIVRKRWSI